MGSKAMFPQKKNRKSVLLPWKKNDLRRSGNGYDLPRSISYINGITLIP
ncbi:hypothetical protein [Candidatus Lokiarchaeum ossiferum]